MECLINIVSAPLLFIACLYVLFYYFGWCFLSVLAITLCSVLSGTLTSTFYSKAVKKVSQADDLLMKVTNEALNNPKMLKLYSWEDLFKQRICQAKAYALLMFKEHEWVVGWMVCFGQFWPRILPVSMFATYIWMGNQLTLSLALLALVLIDQLRQPIDSFPWYIKSYKEMLVSTKCIQKFLICDEVQSNITHRIIDSKKPALSVKGNFSWGVEAKKETEESVV